MNYTTKNNSLCDLKINQKAVVTCLDIYGTMRRRLQDIGLIEGTCIECVNKSPLGDPAAFYIRGAVIALREEISCHIFVDIKN